MIKNYQVERDDQKGICSSVIISDKYALTTAQCWESWITDSGRNYFSGGFLDWSRVILRQGTNNEEVMYVKRFWINPWRNDVSGRGSAYYNIVIMEFGNFFAPFRKTAQYQVGRTAFIDSTRPKIYLL